jgi:imidazolonepropionase-like amidohydrolase
MLALTLSSILLGLPAPQGLTQDKVIQKPAVHKGSLLIEAAEIHIGAGRIIKNSAILVRDGKVQYVGEEIPNAARAGVTKLNFGKSIVVPGFVNPHSNLGHGTNLSEKIDSFTPELLAADAFDPFVKPVQLSANAGITTVGLTPTSLNVFAGQGAAVHTGRIGQLLVESTYLKMSMIDAAFDQNRYPTSRMGAAKLIRSAFKEAGSAIGSTDARLKILHDVIQGGRQLALHVQTEVEINSALDLCKELNLSPLLIGCEEGHKCAKRIAAQSRGVILAPLSFASSRQRLKLPATLEKQGVPFSFMAERPEDLRISAALAVRYGASKQAVLQALTENAAKHVEADKMVGSLFQGKSADFCVFEGHPLDLTSKLTHTYIAGIQHGSDTEGK